MRSSTTPAARFLGISPSCSAPSATVPSFETGSMVRTGGRMGTGILRRVNRFAASASSATTRTNRPFARWRLPPDRIRCAWGRRTRPIMRVSRTRCCRECRMITRPSALWQRSIEPWQNPEDRPPTQVHRPRRHHTSSRAANSYRPALWRRPVHPRSQPLCRLCATWIARHPHGPGVPAEALPGDDE